MAIITIEPAKYKAVTSSLKIFKIIPIIDSGILLDFTDSCSVASCAKTKLGKIIKKKFNNN